MTSIYNTGTVTVTNGSAVVTGSGTAWATALVTGGMFTRLGIAVPILSVDSDTQITLVYAWPGTTASGAAYAIDRENSDASNIVDLYDKLSRVLVTLSLAGITPNSSGTLTDRAALTLAMGDKGYLFLHAEVGVAFAFYRWNGTAWDGPFAVANAVATGGVSSIVGSGITVDNTNPAIPALSIPNDSILNSKLNNMANATVKGRTTAGTGDPEDLTMAQLDALLVAAGEKRESLSANRTYYVGFNMGSATVSIASPGVVTKTSHGLAAGSRVSFSILPNTKTATVSVASPAVVTMTNTFAAGQPIVFATTGRLPKGLVAGTTYYVIATGLSGSSFQVAATVGGAAINTSNPTFTVTIASPGVVTETAHGRSTGDAIQLSTTGALPTGLAAATTYYLNVIDANTYNLRLTPEGANINTTGTQSGTHSIVQFGTHYLSETGTLPTGITAGQDYWVIAAGLTANAFQFSATSGGAAINTTGSTAGTIALKTGSDSSTGLVNSAAGAFLTIQKAIDVISGLLDIGAFKATIQVGAGTYTGLNTVTGPWVGSGDVELAGDITTPSNFTMSVSGTALTVQSGGRLLMKGMKLTNSAGRLVQITSFGYLKLSGKNEFGVSTGYCMVADSGRIDALSEEVLSGGAGGGHYLAVNDGVVYCQATIWTATSPSSFPAFAVATNGSIYTAFNSYTGVVTGSRYNVTLNGVINTNGSGASAFPGNSAGTTGTGGQYA